MRKILILTSKYLPNPSANGINTKYICDELTKRNYAVTCISVIQEGENNYETIDGVEIYRITQSKYTKVLSENNKGSKKIILLFTKIFRYIKNFLLLPMFPNFDRDQYKKTFKLMNRLHLINEYDCVIGINKPYSNIAALKKIKKQNINVVSIGYYLDLINSIKRPKIMPSYIYDFLIKKEIKSSLSVLDSCLIPVGGENLYSNINDNILNKVIYTDFPTFISDKIDFNTQCEVSNRKEINMVYAGTLNRVYRNPERILSILSKTSRKVGNIKLHIYGKNDCIDLFYKYESEPSFQIINHGLTSHNEALSAMQSSSILINVSNKMHDAVPSKIFELFSFGKPIINFVFDKHDITTTYFSKYICAHSLNDWNDDDSQIGKLATFITKNANATFEVNSIKENFIMNTPEYTVDQIEKIMNRVNK